MKRSSLRGFALVFLFLLITATGVFAQSAITGQVTNPSGAVIAGVTVEAASPVLIEGLRSAVTDEQGRYTIVDLRPGTYTMTFKLDGFNTYRRAALELPAGFTATVNAEMRQAQVQPAEEQPSKPSRFQGGLGMMLGVPVGDFGDHVEVGAGVSIKFDVGLGGSPLSVGTELTFLTYGSESLDVPLVGMPELSVEVNRSNDIILFHGRLRAQRREGRVRPYVDGLVGLTNIYTKTSIEGDVTCTGTTGSCVDTGDSVTNVDDVAFSAGGGAGFMVGFTKSPRSARLDVSVRYLYGGEAEYLTEGAIHWGSDAATLLPHRTHTHIVLVDIGIAFGR